MSERWSAWLVVERDLAGDVDAELGRLLDLVEHVRGFEKRLGRNAAAVETGAAELEFFDDGDIETELLGADRGDIAAGAAAEDDEIELMRGGRDFCHVWLNSFIG